MSSKPAVTRPRSLKGKMAPPHVDIGFRWSPVNTGLLVAGLVLLVAGYLSLQQGSTTLAPVLLVAGYCVVIPASLLVRGPGVEAGE